MWEYNYYNPNELYHYGVPGMKWGRRKTRKWAESPHQPSSFKSSVLAGTYAATGSKRVAKALDKSNDKDAKRWEQAKAADPSTYAKQPMSTKKKAAIGTAAVAGAVLAAYGTYKVSGILKDKAFTKAHNRGEEAASKYIRSMSWDEARGLAKRHNQSVGEYFTRQNTAYAKRASKNTIQSIKTLAGKNYELSPAELRLLGIKTF